MHIEQLKTVQEDIETVLSMLKEKDAEIEKKDKIIELMALYIAKLDIDEDICKHQASELCEGSNQVTLDICSKCIKKFFESKVKE